MRRAIAFLALIGIAWLAWMAWQPPFVVTAVLPGPNIPAAVKSQATVLALPERPGEAAALWRVVSRRMIVPKAAAAMKATLIGRGLTVIPVQRQEQVELHAFDDPRNFAKREEAVRVREAWKKAGFDAALIKSDGRFGVALARLYMSAYAQKLQRRLQKSKRRFIYDRRQPTISTWRFTFPAAPYAEAKALWLTVQETGVADPVLMRESRFQTIFGKPVADSVAVNKSDVGVLVGKP